MNQNCNIKIGKEYTHIEQWFATTGCGLHLVHVALQTLTLSLTLARFNYLIIFVIIIPIISKILYIFRLILYFVNVVL